MRRHLDDWSVRDTLTRFIDWGFYNDPYITSIDEEIAMEICDKLEQYVRSAYSEDIISEVYDEIHHFVKY